MIRYFHYIINNTKTNTVLYRLRRNVSQAVLVTSTTPTCLSFSAQFDEDSKKEFLRNINVLNNFVTASEETSLFTEVESCIRRLRYESSHWDDAIEKYRETERTKWNNDNTVVINRIRETAFEDGTRHLKYVHVLDLAQDGMIKPHVDSVRFCGDTIAGLSLLTDSVMRFVCVANKDLYVDVLLKRRSLYVMRGVVRYDYTHEILSKECSIFNGVVVSKSRRISVICRNEAK